MTQNGDRISGLANNLKSETTYYYCIVAQLQEYNYYQYFYGDIKSFKTKSLSDVLTGSGTLSDPYKVADAINFTNYYGQTGSDKAVFIKGFITAIIDEYTSIFGNATFEISDNKEGGNKFTFYRGLYLGNRKYKSGDTQIKLGDEVIIYGNVVNYRGNCPETVQDKAYLYSLNGKTESSGGGGGDTPGGSGGTTVTSLTNGDFETWADDLPTGWKSASTASSATLAQSTDAHGGSYSVNVNGKESSNVRLATQEITLAAGSYNFSFWVKATTTDKAQVRPGYAIVVNGSINSSSGYKYGNYADISTSWTQVSYDFTLDSETTVCLLVMNPKKSEYSSGKDVLVDDAMLTKK